MAKRAPRNNLKVAAFLLSGIAAFGALIWAGANGYLASSGDSEERPLNYLALKLESQYRRDIHNNPYSLDYSAKGPNTIVITVVSSGQFDHALLSSIVRAASENAKGVARDQFGIRELNVETVWKQ